MLGRRWASSPDFEPRASVRRPRANVDRPLEQRPAVRLLVSDHSVWTCPTEALVLGVEHDRCQQQRQQEWGNARPGDCAARKAKEREPDENDTGTQGYEPEQEEIARDRQHFRVSKGLLFGTCSNRRLNSDLERRQKARADEDPRSD
jgi:hypothetical protein